MTGGRWARPGEYSPQEEHHAEERNKNRVQLLQVIDVRRADGVVSGKVGHFGRPVEAPIPLGGLSIHGSKSSWRRYMPQSGDFGILAYGPDDTEVIVGWTSFDDTGAATAEGQRHQHRGYAAVTKRRDDGIPGFREWFDLKEGEWHDRSSGGAYVFGSAGGQLEIGAAQVVTIYDRTTDEVATRAGLARLESGKSYTRLGDVKRRLLPTDFVDTAIPGALPEYHVHLSGRVPAPFPGDLELALYDLHAGDVRDGLGLPVVAPIGPARMRERVFVGTPGDVEVYSRAVDAIGNITEHSLGLMVHDSVLPNTMSSSVLDVLSAPLVMLGSNTAFEPAIKGLTFATAMLPFLTGIVGLTTALSALAVAYPPEHATDIATTPAVVAVGTAAALLAGFTASLTTAMAPGASLSLKVLLE